MQNKAPQKVLDQFNVDKILITGGKGMLGNSFYRKVKSLLPNVEVRNPGKEELDVTSKEQLMAQKEWLKDGIIIHCAALVNVEACASEQEKAKEIIVGGTRNVLDLARATNSKVFYPQSFLIYNCEETPVPESAPPSPLSYYGELKAEAEAMVIKDSQNHLTVRMAGFFGGEERDKNFVGKIIKQIDKLIGENASHIEIGDRVWQPTWTDDLAENSLLLLAAGATGTMQMACHGTASFYELTKAIAELLNWHKHIEIVKVNAAEVSKNELGKRPPSAELSCATLRSSGLDIQRPWREALKQYLSHTYFDQYRR